MMKMDVVGVGGYANRQDYYRLAHDLRVTVLPTGYYGWSGEDLGVRSDLLSGRAASQRAQCATLIETRADAFRLLRGHQRGPLVGD